nr:hypothetical protein [uncultured Cohaesibacter sp.]
MTHRAEYASLVERTFGAGTAKFDLAVAQTNNVIGALAHPSQFQRFNENFKERLRRLSAATKKDSSLQSEILAAVNRMVDAGWDGAYAELCALDYFLAAAETGPGKVELDRTVSASTTLASEMGMTNANHDLHFPNMGISMDTKLLSDKTGQILDGVFKEYRAKMNIEKLSIIPSYDLADDFNRYSANRQALLDELINNVDPLAQPRNFSSKVIVGLSYTFAWNAGVHFGENCYDANVHARNHSPLLFGHAKKFSRVEPSVITFVIFPWSGENVFPFEDSKRTFFKMLGEHFFNDHIMSTQAAKKFNKKFKSEISAGEVSKHLSGLVYLEDNCIMSENSKELNVQASFLWNKHALHPLANHVLETSLLNREAYDLN